MTTPEQLEIALRDFTFLFLVGFNNSFIRSNAL